MKRPRPYIPLSVRVAVAERQYFGEAMGVPREGGDGRWLAFLLQRLSWHGRCLIPLKLQLDHDPALILRFFNPRTRKYHPDANDPDYLVYREKADHQQKTTGRKPGALKTVTTKGSDIGLKRKFAKLEKTTKASRRPKRKIPSRPFAKSKRKFR